MDLNPQLSRLKEPTVVTTYSNNQHLLIIILSSGHKT